MTMAAMMLLLATPLNAAFLGPGASALVSRAPLATMCAAPQRVAVNVEGAAVDLRRRLGLELVASFIATTERGDAAAAMELCTDDLFYKTHSATTESLAAAEKRLHTKVPAPAQITEELHEESPGTFVREIVVKPVPFITVAVRQEFDTRADTDGGVKLSRAEYIKQ